MTEEKILTRVQNLIAKAERTDNEHEKQAYFAKADALMTQHRIDQAMLNTVRPRETRETPIQTVMQWPNNYEFDSDFRYILRTIGETANVHVAIRSMKREAYLVGYADDVEYAEMLWTSVYLAFSSKLDPTWQSEKDFDENVKILKEAGWKWERIANVSGTPWPDGGKLKRAYRRQCSKEGVEPTPHTQRHFAYRAAYGENFAFTVCRRLQDLIERSRKNEGEQSAKTTGMELALRDRRSVAEDYFYTLFPNLRPLTNEQRDELIRQAKERQAMEQAAREALLASMTNKQRAEFLAKEEREEARRQARLNADWERQHASRHDVAGAAAGRTAGAAVDLTAGRNNVKGSNQKRIG